MSINIKKFDNIEKDVFEKEKCNGNYIIINDEDNFSTSYYQYSVNENKKIAFVCGDNYCPKIGVSNDCYILFYVGNIYFYSKETNQLLKIFDNLIYVYDVLEYNNMIYIISETEVMVLQRNLKVVVDRIYDGIIADYNLDKEKLLVKLDNDNTDEILPY